MNDAIELDALPGFVAALQKHPQLVFDYHQGKQRLGTVYCPGCGDRRRVDAQLLHCSMELRNAAAEGGFQAITPQRLTPSLYALSCVQCDTVFTALIYPGPSGPDLAMLSHCRGGLRTPHTPPSVAYYLDQAHRSRAVGAFSAAASMFRAALEQLLFEQGFKKRMLGPKIEELEAAIAAGAAPRWALDLETDYLDVIKALGDGSIHPNDGDITRQEALDNETISRVQTTFLHLLYVVYEVPFRHQDDLAQLKAAASKLKR